MNQGASAVSGDDAGVLDPHAAETGHINAGLHGHGVAGDQRGVTGGRKPGTFVDVDADSMAEAVTETALVAGVVDDIAGDPVDLPAVFPGASRASQVSCA
jgi:hypothetical protein